MTFIFGEMPEEIREMIDRRHLEAQVTRNEVDRLLDELSIEDLVTFRTVMRYVASEPSAYNFFDGVIYSRLRREGRCTSCGEPDHDHEAFQAALDSSDGDISFEPGAISVPLVEDEEYGEELTINGLTTDDLQNMAAYNIDDLRDEDSNELLGFICLNCGMRYPSIEDRMLRSPDECSGCFRKAGHG